jgi:CheY-like chemotaxis protein/HPt (histidine-containing phosphotransfer) domain-containing protein
MAGAPVKLALMSVLGAQVDAEGIAGTSLAGTLTKPLRPERIQALAAEALGRAGSAPANRAKETAAAAVASAEVKSRYRIMVAEDNPTNQLVALGMLRKLGYHADLVTNGREALQRLAQDPYDLVLMDCQMPEMDGFEAVACLRANTPPTLNPQVPVVAMTADAMQSAREACLAAGMDDYLSKPISLALLAATLKQWLPQAPAVDVATANPAAREPRPEGDAPVFDHAGLMKRVMHDERLARVVLGGFLQDMPQQLAMLRRQTEAGDGLQVGLQAHRIRGASANVGGGTMQAVAQAIEKLGNDGNLQEVSPLLAQLEAQFGRMQERIEETLQRNQQTQAAS